MNNGEDNGGTAEHRLSWSLLLLNIHFKRRERTLCDDYSVLFVYCVGGCVCVYVCVCMLILAHMKVCMAVANVFMKS